MCGWVCARCADELDWYIIIRMGATGGTAASVYEAAKRRSELPAPGPRPTSAGHHKTAGLGSL